MIRMLPLVALLSVVPLSSRAAGPDDLVRRTLEANATLDALEEQRAAMQHRITRASAGPEPVIGLEYSNMPVTSPYPGVHPMSGVQLSVRQTVLYPGTISARRSAAEARLSVAGEALIQARVDLAAAVRGGYWQLARLRLQTDLVREQIALADQLVEAVRGAYEVGRAEQHQLLSAELGRDRLVEGLEDLGRAEREVLAALAAAVQQPGQLEVSTPTSVDPIPGPPPVESLVREAADHNPTLALHAATAEAEGRLAEAARKEARPDLTMWAGYRMRAPIDGMDDGMNQASLGISIPLPTSAARRWGATEAEHEARARAATSRRDSAAATAEGDIHAAIARWDRAADRVTSHHERLIPAAEATWDATLAAYRVDRARFATLTRAWEQLLDLQRAALDAEVDVRLAAIEVDRLTGVIPHEEVTR